jgi:hypothetical protein
LEEEAVVRGFQQIVLYAAQQVIGAPAIQRIRLKLRHLLCD